METERIILPLPVELIRQIRYLAGARAQPPNEVAAECMQLGVNILEGRRRRHGKRGANDACTRFSHWLVDDRGYRESTGRSNSSLVRRAIQSTYDLDVWAGEQNNSNLNRALVLWREFCAEHDHKERSLEWG